MKTINYSLPVLVVLASLCGFSVVDSQKDCGLKRLSTSKLVCYYGTLEDANGCFCTHVILPANSDVKRIETLKTKGVKVFIRVSDFHQGLIDLLKSTKVDGLELNLKKLTSKNDISDFISTIKTKLGSDLDIALSVPSKPELVAKYFDFKALSKHAELFILETAFLGASTNITFHPSRLSGMWDMQNTLQNPDYTAPGSPALEVKSINRDQLCRIMKDSQNWTLERDEDQAGPYIFSKDQWIAFDDSKSIDIKAKYVRVRGLAGMALKDLANDGGSECDSTILESTFNGLSRQARAPRGAVLRSLEREIVDSSSKPLDSVQISPFRISRIIDTEGKIHVIRQDSRTEFQCSRQGYFVHPRSCNRFYRCVKFNQLKEEYNVFEFDCPAGLAFDERVEVCVWPGSLPHGTPCSGSSEIAPVPRERFVCPSEPGYYADPENCRWFFACLDHGKSPLQAYEFRCPFGLVFDGDRLVCEWPWLVPKCSNGAASGLDSGFYYGGSQNQGAPGLILQSYDGLGSLGAVKLGGVSGTIERPLTALYTNAASGALGLGYPNHQGYIGGGGGLSYKEAQALQNAGFLRVNNGVGYQASAQSGQAGLSYVSTGSAGGAHQQGGALVGGASLGLGSDYYTSGQYETSSGQAQEEPLEVALRNDGSKGAAVSSQSFTRYHGLTGGSANSAAGSHEYNQGNYATSKPGLQSIDSASYGNNGLDFGAKLVGNGAGGASYSQYHGEKEAKNSLQYGGVNIIGGGYSAVGTLSNVNIYPNGQSHVVTASPEVLPVAKIPTVTAVPVPGIKAISGFDTIRGGVIANIPELQYKVKSFEDAGLFTNGSTNFVNFVVTSAPASQQTYSQTGGYAYNKPAISFEEKPVKTVGVSTEPNLYISSTGAPLGGVAYSTPKPFTVVPTGYSYEKPLVKFEETPQVSSTPAPHSYQAVGISQENEQASVVSKFSFGSAVGQQTGTSAGYYYQQPVAANEIPEVKQEQVVTYYQPQQYFYQQQPVPLTQQPERLSTYTYQPPVQRRPAVTPYTYQNVVQQAVGVVYKQPETSPVLPVQSAAYLPIRGPSYQYIHSYTNEQNANNAQHDRYVYSTPRPLDAGKPAQPAVVTSYFNLQSSKAQAQSNAQQANAGYTYSKPSVTFGEAPASFSTPKPDSADINSYFNVQTSKAQSQSSAQQANVGYEYSKPSVSFLEAPVVVSTPKPASAVASSYFNLQTSKAQAHNEQQQANVGYTYAKPSVSFVEAPKPALAVVNSYFNLQSSNAQAERGTQHENVGYTYSKPVIGFEETPVRLSTSKPSPSSYFSLQSSKAQAESSAQQANAGYIYAKPSVSFEEAPRRVEVPTQPAVVSSYFNIAAAQASAGNLQEEVNVEYSHPQRQEPQRPQGEVVGAPYSTPKPFAAVSSYFNLDASNSHAQSEQRQENYGYTYSKPTELQHSPAKPAVVSSYFNLESAHRPKPQTPPVEPYSSSYFHIDNSQEQPAGQRFYQANSVVSSTSRPLLESKPAASYSFTSGSTTAQPILVQEVPSAKPAVVSSYFNQPPSRGYEYSKPAISFNEEPQPVQEEAFVKKTAYVTGHYDDDYRYKNRGKVVVESYKLPQYEAALAPTVYQQQPQVVYNYVPSTPRPTLISTLKSIAKQPVSPALVRFYDNYSSTPATSSVSPEVLSSTSRPISRYSFSSLDEQYQYNNLVKATTSEPLRIYLPVTSTVRIATSSPKVSKVVEEYVAPEARDYLPPQVRTKAPSREYLPVEVTTPSREYLPVRVRTKAPPKYVAVEVAAPSREYLPSRRVKVTSTTSAPEITTLSREYLPVRVRVTSTVKPSRPVTIIKANDAHPLLSAKLGAQCTCVSNTLKLRKKQKIIIVEDEDEDDGYAVDDAGYEAQRVVDITPTPEVYAKKVVRPGAVGENYYTPVTDVFYQKNTSPAPEASDKEIVKAVRTGLKLVKQAAKDGAREGTSEVLSKHLDRYGPGGVRSRSETLQGTIDCQRAGLFRHPTECNKFYACRWDCTKNRFTLHVFNCPVQLTFDNSLGACNWPSQGPACVDNTLITSD
ncbi:hypothetical protein HUJ04_007975 [Dendroctonus ponderosae]|nr:hypothetical protein HUJ04_007975 [Dendroctonus ponderosae]